MNEIITVKKYLVYVDECASCPNLKQMNLPFLWFDKCDSVGGQHRRIKNIHSIPSWCPLADIEVKKIAGVYCPTKLPVA